MKCVSCYGKAVYFGGTAICYNCRVDSINSLATHGFKSDAVNLNISATVGGDALRICEVEEGKREIAD